MIDNSKYRYFDYPVCSEKCDNYITERLALDNSGTTMPIVLVALKHIDNPTFVCSDEGKELAKMYNVPFFEVDTLTGN